METTKEIIGRLGVAATIEYSVPTRRAHQKASPWAGRPLQRLRATALLPKGPTITARTLATVVSCASNTVAKRPASAWHNGCARSFDAWLTAGVAFVTDAPVGPVAGLEHPATSVTTATPVPMMATRQLMAMRRIVPPIRSMKQGPIVACCSCPYCRALGSSQACFTHDTSSCCRTQPHQKVDAMIA